MTPQQPPPDKPLRDKKLILYIDHNELNRAFVQLVLEAEGYQVIEAENGLAGIEMIFAEYPDLVLLDMNSSDINSWEVADIIRERISRESMPIVGFTASSCIGRTSIDVYVSKPVGVGDLKRVVADFLEEKDT